MAEKLEGKPLKVSLARTAIKVGNRIKNANPEDAQRLIVAIGLLNHAQGLVEVDDSKANRLLSLGKSLIK